MDLTLIARPEDHEAASYVRNSRFFDATFYLASLPEAESVAAEDPALHYVVVGEAAGISASESFAAPTYVSLNPDLATAPINKLFHYETSGRVEGRAVAYLSESLALNRVRIDPGKPTVLLLMHEATYSGAPLLGWNLLQELKLTRNVVVVLQRGGALEPAVAAFASAVVGPLPTEVAGNPLELRNVARRLVHAYSPIYVIANSVETAPLATALRGQGAPCVALVHEFATHSLKGALEDFYKSCAAIVFPAELVRRSSMSSYALIAQRRTFILPQGPSAIPRLHARAVSAGPRTVEDESAPKLEEVLAESPAPFTVVGLGAVDLRKGVDLFVATATAVKAKHPDLAIRFIWLGERVHPTPHQYYTFLDEQVARSGLGEALILSPGVDDLEPVYAAADALFISSRLDPLPNVGIDAAMRGLPLLCFNEATGFAELLARDASTAWLVAPHLDTGAVADAIARLALDGEARRRAGTAMRRIARTHFDMMSYAAKIDDLGRQAARRRDRSDEDAAVLAADSEFDVGLYFGSKPRPVAREAAIRAYLDDTRDHDFSGPAVWGVHPRRAAPGFHALAYGTLPGGLAPSSDADPLVDYVRRGKPAGPWRHDVIKLAHGQTARAPPRQARIAVHGHFHYVDNIGDFLSALDGNACDMDLFVTTNDQAAANILQSATRDYGKGSISVDVVPNVGRDIKPFIDLVQDRLADYDIVGHLHGKRSVHTLHYDSDLGNRWRHFLWQHLIGPAAAAADVILERFQADSKLGLVFPENDFLVGWEKNAEVAGELAPRLGLGQLPEHIEFPVGTMFWARPQVFRALVDARFTNDEYPSEPLPIDGTMLHALERMIPLIAEAAGYHYATTFFPAFSR